MTFSELADFHRDGFVVVPSLFDAEEIGRLAQHAKNDPDLAAEAYGRKDATGMPVRLALWNTPGDDLYGMFSRSRRIVDRMEQLLGGEVYHWHAKLILKNRASPGPGNGIRIWTGP